MMTMNKIEEKLYKKYGSDLFIFYKDGYILENQYTSTGINIDDIESAWFDNYDYLTYPVFEQQHPLSFDKEFTYQEKRKLIFLSPVILDSESSDISKYKLDKIMYYTPYDKPNVIRRMMVPRGIVDVNKITILKIKLSNGRVIPVLTDGNSLKCEEDGIYIENDGLLTPTVDYFNRAACVSMVLKEFGVKFIDNPDKQ